MLARMGCQLAIHPSFARSLPGPRLPVMAPSERRRPFARQHEDRLVRDTPFD